MKAPVYADGSVAFMLTLRCRLCEYETACEPCFKHHWTTRHSAPRSIPTPRRWTRAVVGDDVYLDLLETIDPGDEL